MTSKSSVNLKLYLLNTALPEMRLGSGAPKMPPASHKSHTNSLTIRFEPSRKLHAIYQLRGDIYEESVPACKLCWSCNCASVNTSTRDRTSHSRKTHDNQGQVHRRAFNCPGLPEYSAYFSQIMFHYVRVGY